MGNSMMKMRQVTSTLIVFGALTGVLAGCGHSSDKPASQVLAKVNDDEITVMQLNGMLAQQAPTEQNNKAMRQQALEYLVDQAVLVEKAKDLKLDQDPSVLAAVEASRRQILAAAAAQKVLKVTPTAPSDKEIDAFYAQHPNWFAQRRLFDFINFLMPRSAVGDALLTKLNSSTSPDETRALLTGANIDFKSGPTQLGSDRISAAVEAKLNTLKAGDILINKTPEQVILMQFVKADDGAIDAPTAHDTIVSFLTRQRTAEATQVQMDALKKAVKISYLQHFADLPAESSAPVSNNKDVLQSGMKGLQ
jgi:EpsD family peptidyl-prolyl cis-trans isomerase